MGPQSEMASTLGRVSWALARQPAFFDNQNGLSKGEPKAKSEVQVVRPTSSPGRPFCSRQGVSLGV